MTPPFLMSETHQVMSPKGTEERPEAYTHGRGKKNGGEKYDCP
jgi:hypothetical protein